MSKPPPEILLSELRETVRVIRENLLRQEALLEQVMVALEQRESDPSLSRSSAAESTVAWHPAEDGAVMTGQLPTVKIRKVESHPGTSDIVTRLKKSWFGRFYLERLKQIPLIRKLVIAVWCKFYPAHARISAILHARVANRWRPIVKLADYVNASNISTIKVFDAERIDTPPPVVIPHEDQAYLVSPHDCYEFPPIYVAQLSDAQVYGKTNLVFLQDAVICHDLYDFERDYTSEELHGRHVIDARKKRMRLLRNDATPEHIPVAAAFLDACAPNYAHWLTEVLPRIAVFCSLEQHANVPIIVDDDLHPNIMESLGLVVGSDREIFTLPVGRAINVDVLYITSVAGYVPFERRDKRLDGHSHGLFSTDVFSEMRRILVDVIKETPSSDWPKKIYLRRNSGVRKVLNSTEIERALVAQGYAVIEPEKLSFTQQVMLFSRAEAVVASSGAAVANIIFCPPGARITILIGRFPDTSYWYWQNIAAASGNLVRYVLCETALGLPHGIHADFYVNVEFVENHWQNN